jgi:hypothetical protein
VVLLQVLLKVMLVVMVLQLDHIMVQVAVEDLLVLE